MERIRERASKRVKDVRQAALAERLRFEEHIHQQEKMEAVGYLAGGVAHDFNNQLTVMIGCTQVLAGSELSPAERRAYIAKLQSCIERSTDLTKKLLAFARKGKYRDKVVSLNKIIEEVRFLVSPTLTDKKKIEFSNKAAHDEIRGDPTQIHNAVLNLVFNARDALSRGEGQITLGTEIRSVTRADPNAVFGGPLPGEYVVLTVRDTGDGILQENKARIFEPFFTTKDDGTGMALAGLYGMIQTHGGEIVVESERGVGTAMHIYFPLQETAAWEKPMNVSNAPGASPAPVKKSFSSMTRKKS
ncbi:MAG: hypothetical protein JNM63_05290 [Spirochaetia bacterium]|nr:hypothetical protein [Spirochaetia bacterium]